MAKKRFSYNNLIDLCIKIDENEEFSGDMNEIFIYLLKSYFFPETEKEKGMMNFYNNFEVPEFIKDCTSLLNIDLNKLREFIENESTTESLSGKIIMSKAYLKIFYSNHSPEFSKIPPDIQLEIVQKVKDKNNQIIGAFEKMLRDRDYDKKRTIIKLIALILKNIHLKTGLKFVESDNKFLHLIEKEYSNFNDVFNASQVQLSNLNDETKIKKIIKTFFTVKNFKDITDITKLYKDEIERYRKRALRL